MSIAYQKFRSGQSIEFGLSIKQVSALREVTIRHEREIYRKDEFAIGRGLVVSPRDLQGETVGYKSGSWPDGALVLGGTYRLFGKFEDSKYGPTINFSSYTMPRPTNRNGVLAYLQTVCKGSAENPGIGPSTAAKLWQEFNEDAVRMLREHPEDTAAAVTALKPETAQWCSETLKRYEATEETRIALLEFLDKRGLPRNLPELLIAKYGVRAVDVVYSDPYKLLNFPRCGFQRVDTLYVELAGDKSAGDEATLQRLLGRMKRQVHAGCYKLAELQSRHGHVWFPVEVFAEAIRSTITSVGIDKNGQPLLNPAKAVGVAVRSKMLAHRCDETGQLWLAPRKTADDEAFLAIHLATMNEARRVDRQEEQTQVETVIRKPTHTRCHRCHRQLTAAKVHVLEGLPYGPECIKKAPGGENATVVSLDDWLDGKATVIETETTKAVTVGYHTLGNSEMVWPEVNDESLSEHQREELAKALQSPIGVLTGSAGTGKTRTTASLVREAIAMYGSGNVAVCAPTGKAAVRCTEAMGELGIDMRATTIHSLLGVEHVDGGGWTFRHREGNPLPFKIVIVDEAPMVDCSLGADLFRARDRRTGILLIGDPYQLSPVGPGAPLRDLCKTDISQGHLREIWRNSGTIVKVATAIRDRNLDGLQFSPKINLDSNENLVFVECTRENQQNVVMGLIEATATKWAPVWETQVVVAVNSNSPCSRETLSGLLQEKFNPAYDQKGLRVGDKVFNTKNGFFMDILDRGEERFVANGDLGRVEAINDKTYEVKFFNPDRTVLVPRFGGDNGGCPVVLGYAATCHKMQGSQTPLGIYVLDEYPGATGTYGIVDMHHLYTGITRSQQAGFIIGTPGTLRRICQRSFMTRRKTFLQELIRDMRIN
jgi:hypothetical protein